MRHSVTKSLDTAETAKLMRKALKKAFPATTFTVRTSKYAGGSSINVGWTDGPTTPRVDEILGAYEGKGFDGSIDMAYYIHAWVLNGEILGTQCSGTAGSGGRVEPWGMITPHDDAELVSFGGFYLHTKRIVSPALAAKCAAQVAAYWGGVTAVPVFGVNKWGGLELAPESPVKDFYAPVRADLGGNRSGDHYSWYACIHRASEDATAFTREEVTG